ncbi:DUF420 domain-containing protein [Cohnella sp. AR92]|uniref:DUF420 domain-containing protein n=1 Tax=Cohnella sp. AR92 TaxID=648716 RepID=UPI000F8F11DF|nr:DUF420 domain-containing protein [Cohnella sp. AR92]RUS45810.1 DUF420 domain-containing protein [Cohnella sp. AR92]
MSNKSDSLQPTSNKNYTAAIIAISLVANIIILLLFFSPLGYKGEIDFDLTIFPRVNGLLNSFTFIFLLAAFIAILKKNVRVHKAFILAAFSSTLLFLVSYLTFHFLSTETATYGGEGFVRPVYFFILISHSILAAIIVPLALFTLVWGWTNQLHKHRRIARWTMPIWLYVSLTGVVVFLMMEPYY